MLEEKMEKTLIIIKPDGIEKMIIPEVLRRLKMANLFSCYFKMSKLSPEIIEKLYAHVKAKVTSGYFNSIVDYMTSGNVIIGVFEGENAVQKVREICGPTDPLKAKIEKPNSIRALYSDDSLELVIKEQRAVKNIIHASGSVEEAKKRGSCLEFIRKY